MLYKLRGKVQKFTSMNIFQNTVCIHFRTVDLFSYVLLFLVRDPFHVYLNKCEFHFRLVHIYKTDFAFSEVIDVSLVWLDKNGKNF